MGAPGEDTLVLVRLTPRAAREAIGPWRGDRLQVRTTAPPADGRANDALCRALAGALDVAPSRVTVVRGTRSREKTVQVAGMPAAETLRRLGRPGSA